MLRRVPSRTCAFPFSERLAIMRCALENISTADGIRNPSSSLALAIIICANEVTSRADGRRVGATCCELVLLVMIICGCCWCDFCDKHCCVSGVASTSGSFASHSRVL